MSREHSNQGQGGQEGNNEWQKSFDELSDEEKEELARKREQEGGVHYEKKDEDSEGSEEGPSQEEEAPQKGSEKSPNPVAGTRDGEDLGAVPNREQEQKESEREQVQDKMGYHPLPVTALPTQGLFYPEDIDIRIRPALSQEIRHWSAMDDEDPNSIINHLNDIVAACTRVTCQSDNKYSSYKDICDEDRFAVTMAIRDLTFPKGENELAFNQGCTECGESVKFSINGKSIVNDEPTPDIMGYYSPDERQFIVRTKDYGEIRIRSPKLGIMQRVKDYVNNLRRENMEPDTTFTKLLPYMVNDWRAFNRETIRGKFFEYRQWDPYQLSLMLKLTEWAYSGPTQYLRSECGNCGAEVRAAFRFPGSIKDLFLVSDLSGQLL